MCADKICKYNKFYYSAVVWTDTLQFFLMLGAVVLVIGLGILNLNNPLDIWYAAERSERLIFFKLVFFAIIFFKRR